MRAAQVKVFWPGMCKWYAGRVGAYDAQTGQHTILYRDGDVKQHALQHEALLWTDIPGLDAASLTAARLKAGFGTAPPLVRAAVAAATVLCRNVSTVDRVALEA